TAARWLALSPTPRPTAARRRRGTPGRSPQPWRTRRAARTGCTRRARRAGVRDASRGDRHGDGGRVCPGDREGGDLFHDGRAGLGAHVRAVVVGVPASAVAGRGAHGSAFTR